jgi:oligopeptide transport system substrate-binding protein
MRGPLALLIVTLGITACTRSASGYYGTTEPKHGPDEIWSNLGAEPEYIDPGKASESSGGAIITNVFAGLTQPHPVSLEPMPDIAARWDISADGTRYTFHLRPSVWSDGTPLTAADFVYSWRRVLNPQTASKYASFLYPLRYGELFNRRAIMLRGVGSMDEAALRAKLEPIAALELVRMAPELDAAFVIVAGDEAARPALRDKLIRELNGKTLSGRLLRVALVDESVIGVRASDPLTLVVDLENPLPYFLHIVKFYTAMPVPRHVIERLVKAGKNPDLWTRPESIVSNGAYVVEAAKFRQFLRLAKNPRYWDAAHVRLGHVRLSLIESSNTTLNMYEAGELDSIGSTVALPSEFMDTLSTQKDFARAPQVASYFYWINTKQPPLDDPRVRNALRFAIDRKTLVEKIARAGQIPSADLVPDGLAGYRGLASPVFDPARARRLLQEAGYGPGHRLPKVTLTYNTSEGHKQLAEAIQAMWRSQLGIEVELENQEWKVFLKTLQTGSFQIARMGWIGDYPDPNTFLEVLTSASGNNHSGWHDPNYEALLQRANATPDPSARLLLMRQAEGIAMAAAPIIPIYVYTRSELIKPYLRGHFINYENRHIFKYWWIDKRWYHGIPTTRLPDGFPPPLAASLEPRRGGAATVNSSLDAGGP